MKRRIKQLAHALLAPFAPAIWRSRGESRLLVLMYHRVLPHGHPDRPREQPGMYVSPQTLAMHLGLLRRYFEMVHLDDWAQRVAQGLPVPPLACAVTFDDGWRDNFEHAFPILEAQQVPATIYLLPGLVGTHYSFWPNRLARLLSDARNDVVRDHWPDWLKQEVEPEGALPLPVASIDGVIGRCKARYTDVAMLELMRDVVTPDASQGDRDLMNWHEVRQMAASGYVRFGSHTRRHIRLDARTAVETMQDEIRESRAQIEQELRTPVTSFCYPNGDHCHAAVELVRGSYATAVTTRRGWNSPTSDRYLLNRVGVHEDISSTAPAFLSRLALAVSAK